MKTAIQLYSVGKELDNDFKGTCRKLSEMGWRGVEIAFRYGGMEPAELADFFAENGLVCNGIYESTPNVCDPRAKCYEFARALGVKYMTAGCSGDFTKVWPECAAMCRKAGIAAAENGLRFTYHNHAAEFAGIDGRYALDLILENTDEELVGIELDVGWVKVGGADPAEFVRRYADRIPLLHMRDADFSNRICDLGTGTVDLAACAAEAGKGACEWLVYEQDRYPVSALKSAETSLKFLTSLIGKQEE